jgi:hypothetical protein
MVEWGLWPAQVTAGVCTIVKDADGKVVVDAKGEPVRRAKYTGPARTAAFLRVVVHQQKGRRRP